jgi:hypothetical protein
MPGFLVDDQDIYDYLDLSPSEDDPNSNVLKIRDAVEAQFAHDTNRTFGPAAVIVQEMYDGSGTHSMFTRRPIAILDNIEFAYLPENQQPFYQLDITNYITFRPNSRRIHSRLIKFPCGTDNVLISYHTAADQPVIAQQAVREGTALLWRTRGSEDARSEQMGNYQHVLKRKLDESIFWSHAVESLSYPVLG